MRQRASKPARRRAKQQRSRQTVAAVLAAAARVLQREGYARATTNRIAAVAGVSVGSLYQYFGDKDAVFDALIRQELGALRGLLEKVEVDPREPIAQSLARVLGSLVRARPDAPLLYRSLEQVPGAVFRRRVAEARDGLVRWVRAFLEAHRAQLRVRDLDAAAFLLVASAEGVAVNASPDFYRSRGAGELAALFSLYLTGGGAPPRPADS